MSTCDWPVVVWYVTNYWMTIDRVLVEYRGVNYFFSKSTTVLDYIDYCPERELVCSPWGCSYLNNIGGWIVDEGCRELVGVGGGWWGLVGVYLNNDGNWDDWGGEWVFKIMGGNWDDWGGEWVFKILLVENYLAGGFSFQNIIG
jgi:hypothetical protein